MMGLNGLPEEERSTTTAEATATADGQNGQNGQNGQAGQTSTSQQPKQPYSGFQGSNYAELEDFIKGQMADVKAETPEERRKRERREKWEGVINGIADMGMALGNLYFTSQYAPNAYNGQNSMSEKYRQRLDKAKADREKNRDAYINYALTLGKLKDADRDFNFRVEQARNQQNNWQTQFDAGRKDRANDVAYRDKAYADSRQDRADDVTWRKERANVEDEHWNKNFTESMRQFNVSSSLQRRSLSLQAQRLQHELESDSATYTLGEGQGSVKVPKAAINSLNFAAVYNSLPSQYRTAQGKPITNSMGMVTGYGTPDAESMAIAVGAYLGDSSIPADQKTATRTALSQLGKTQGSKNRTMPGVIR